VTRAPAIVQTSMIHVDEKQDRSAGSDGRLRLRKRGDLPCLTERVPPGGVRQFLWRRAAVINVFRDGVMSNADEPLLAGVPVIPRGDRMGGQFFPLLLDEEAVRGMSA